MRLPPLTALRAFEAAARHQGFIAAADELFVTRGAISRQVKILEDHIGVPLFHRNARGVELTAAVDPLAAAAAGTVPRRASGDQAAADYGFLQQQGIRGGGIRSGHLVAEPPRAAA